MTMWSLFLGAEQVVRKADENDGELRNNACWAGEWVLFLEVSTKESASINNNNDRRPITRRDERKGGTFVLTQVHSSSSVMEIKILEWMRKVLHHFSFMIQNCTPSLSSSLPSGMWWTTRLLHRHPQAVKQSHRLSVRSCCVVSDSTIYMYY